MEERDGMYHKNKKQEEIVQRFIAAGLCAI
jgi:hypothetical protein